MYSSDETEESGNDYIGGDGNKPDDVYSSYWETLHKNRKQTLSVLGGM